MKRSDKFIKNCWGDLCHQQYGGIITQNENYYYINDKMHEEACIEIVRENYLDEFILYMIETIESFDESKINEFIISCSVNFLILKKNFIIILPDAKDNNITKIMFKSKNDITDKQNNLIFKIITNMKTKIFNLNLICYDDLLNKHK